MPDSGNDGVKRNQREKRWCPPTLQHSEKAMQDFSRPDIHWESFPGVAAKRDRPIRRVLTDSTIDHADTGSLNHELGDFEAKREYACVLPADRGENHDINYGQGAWID
jgi:hypothetical protein